MMASDLPDPTGLAERLKRNRRRLFIGRSRELQALTAFATASVDEPGIVAHLCAPGGVGKTTLLKAFLQETTSAFPILWLDARDIPPDPTVLADTIQALRAHRGIESNQPHLLIIDTFENLAPLESWLRNTFIPEQVAGFRLILASRNEPEIEWRTDPDWVEEHQYWVLSPFSLTETRQYMALRGLDSADFDRAYQFARGNPLALALYTDSIRQNEAATHSLTQSWRQRLVSSINNDTQLAALEACCVVRRLDEPMLARMLDRDNAGDLLQWLQSQSYIESSGKGLFPHDLLRKAFIDDLTDRDPTRLIQLADRAFSALHDRLENETVDRLGLIQDAFFLMRGVNIQQETDNAEELAVYVDNVRQADWPAIDDMIRRFENDSSVSLVHELYAAQPQALKVVRDANGNTRGFFQIIRVDLLPASLLDLDPVCAKFLDMVQNTLNHQGTAVLNRFWLDRDQDMAATTSVYTQAFSHLAFISVSATPAVLGSRQGDTPDWRRAVARFGHNEAMLDDSERQGMPAMFIYQDLTADERAGINWLRHAYRYAFGLEDPLTGASSAATSLPDQNAFQRALRQAFRDATRLDKLENNALLDCRLVLKVGATDDPLNRAQTLQRLLEETCTGLETQTSTQSLARVLQATYLRPAPNQQAAADRLALSYATYRRRLTEALKLVESEWWAEELKLRRD